MLVQTLGIIDIIAGAILILNWSGHLPQKVILFIGMVLILKSLIGFFKDFASWIDFLSGLTFLILALINVPPFITIILGILIIQKGVVSFI